MMEMQTDCQLHRHTDRQTDRHTDAAGTAAVG